MHFSDNKTLNKLASDLRSVGNHFHFFVPSALQQVRLGSKSAMGLSGCGLWFPLPVLQTCRLSITADARCRLLFEWSVASFG